MSQNSEEFKTPLLVSALFSQTKALIRGNGRVEQKYRYRGVGGERICLMKQSKSGRLGVSPLSLSNKSGLIN